MAASSSTPSIRPVDQSSPEDLQHFKTMTVKYLEWLNEDLCFQGIEQELESLPGCYSPTAGGCMLLAFISPESSNNESPSTCIGAVALRALDGKQEEGITEVAGLPVAQVCEMKRLFVVPEYHGKGAGKALVEALLEEAEKIGYKAIVLDTLERLEGANRLYRSLGFQACEPYNHCPLPKVLYHIKTFSSLRDGGD